MSFNWHMKRIKKGLKEFLALSSNFSDLRGENHRDVTIIQSELKSESQNMKWYDVINVHLIEMY